MRNQKNALVPKDHLAGGLPTNRVAVMIKAGGMNQSDPPQKFPRVAGLLLYQVRSRRVYVWLAHMGGPKFARGNRGWTLPKGQVEDFDLDDLAAARREYKEEMGADAPKIPYLQLGKFDMSKGSLLTVYTGHSTHANFQPSSNYCNSEWPPQSGIWTHHPEIDDAKWILITEAYELIFPRQRPILSSLMSQIERS
ncbi:hydrolase, NUDIX family (plasmid) [Arthrobacter sp. ZXY-2]|nr:hydrolase, NUDIX family [Arthrobacter sp. ZXY-2]